MGSFQQISLGVVCLVAAFMFGNYVNNHPDPDKVTTAFSKSDVSPAGEATSSASSQQVIRRAAPMETLRAPATAQQPTMKLPNLFGLANPRTSPSTLPPPSQLELPATTRAPAAPVKMPNLVESRKRREVMVPDFSSLAAEFRNTPLELPPMQKLNHDRVRDLADQPWRASSVNDDRKTYAQTQVLPNPTTTVPSFNPDDFAPKLKQRFETNPVSGLEIPSQAALPPIEGSPPIPSSGRQVVPPVAIVNDFSRPNSVRSRALDTVPPPPTTAQRMGQSEFPMSADVQRDADSTGWSNAARPTLPPVSPPNYSTARPIIPFGLTAEAKSNLVRLRRPASTQVEIGTSRFAEHWTQPGDSLQSLSTRFYGRPDFYLDIYLANQNQLRNPASLPAGIVLKIPIFD